MNQINETNNVNNALNIGPKMRVYQVNVEGISCAKSDFLSKQFKAENIDIGVIQETHTTSLENIMARGKIPGYDLVVSELSRSHGIATYKRTSMKDVSVVNSITADNIYSSTVAIGSMSITNVYKAPPAKWPQHVLKTFPHPAVYIGDFNSHHRDWGYSTNDENGESIANWASINELHLVHDLKAKGTFFSRVHRRDYNPDLCFVSTDEEGSPLCVTRKVLSAFPNSQHRPVIIEIGMSIPIINSIPRPRWNFQKANWTKYQEKIDASVRFIPPDPKNYDRFAKLIIATAKQCVPRGYRKEYIPCWSEDSDRLYNEFIETESPEVAKELMESLDDARRSKWIHTVESIDMRRSSRKAWSLIRKLGGASPVEL